MTGSTPRTQHHACPKLPDFGTLGILPPLPPFSLSFALLTPPPLTYPIFAARAAADYAGAYYSPGSNPRSPSFKRFCPPPELRGIVDDSDFTYHEILGVGGFGFVVKVLKRSTGASYAMKIQNKLSSMITARNLVTKKVRKLKFLELRTGFGPPPPLQV